MTLLAHNRPGKGDASRAYAQVTHQGIAQGTKSDVYDCLVISCFIKIQTGLTFLMPAYPGCPGKLLLPVHPLNGFFQDNLGKPAPER